MKSKLTPLTSPCPSFSGGESVTCSGRCFFKENGVRCSACRPLQKGRRVGKSFSQVVWVAELVKDGGEVPVGGLNDPSRYLEFMKSVGINARADLMSYNPKDGVVVESGYVFRIVE